SVRFESKVHDDQRCQILDSKRRNGDQLDADRLGTLPNGHRDGTARQPEIPRELAGTATHRIRREHEIVEQWPGAERRRPCGLESEIGCWAFLLRARNEGPVNRTRDPSVGILKIFFAYSRGGHERAAVVADLLERGKKDAQVSYGRRWRRAERLGIDAIGQ